MLYSLCLDDSTENILFENGLDKETFKYFLNNILFQKLNDGYFLIMDNCRAHKINFNKLEDKEIPIKPLPRYSPDLNPIEMMLSKIKTKLRKKEYRLPPAASRHSVTISMLSSYPHIF